MDPYEDFEAFTAAVEEGSVSAGARRLGVPRATLSRQLSRLEARLGVRLAHRDTRRFELTEAGATLYERARAIVADAYAATEAVARLDGVPRGLLRVSTPPMQGVGLGDLFLSFADRWPEVRLEVLSTTEHVDLRAQRVDVALRAGALTDPDLVARVVWHTQERCVAAPAYLAARGVPSTVDDLASHECVVGFDRGVTPATTWPTPTGARVRVQGRLVANDLQLRVEACLRGQGIALLPDVAVRGALREGALVEVLRGALGRDTTLALVWVERSFLDPKVRAFVDHAVAWFQTWTPGDLRRG